jgi:hypothetical protein
LPPGTNPERVANEAIGIHVALAIGSNLYPELAVIRPVRPANAVPCTSCDGTGRRPEWPANVLCGCGGLGWRPAASSSAA